MHRTVVNVGAERLGDIKPVALCFRSLTEVLLLVQNIVLGASNDTGILDALDGLGYHKASERRIGRETLPVSATIRVSAERTGNRAQLHIDALVAKLLTHSEAAEVGQLLVPSAGDGDTGGKGGIVVSWKTVSIKDRESRSA